MADEVRDVMRQWQKDRAQPAPGEHPSVTAMKLVSALFKELMDDAEFHAAVESLDAAGRAAVREDLEARLEYDRRELAKFEAKLAAFDEAFPA